MGGLTFDPPLGPPGYSRMLAPDRRPHRPLDGHICILPYTDRHWRDFFRIAGRPELAEDPRLADAQTRARHVAELYALVADCVRDAPTAYWLDKLEGRRHPVRPGQPACRVAGRRAPRRRRILSASRASLGGADPDGAAAGAVRRGRLRACGIRRRGSASIPARSLREAGLGEREIDDLLARKIAIAAA